MANLKQFNFKNENRENPAIYKRKEWVDLRTAFLNNGNYKCVKCGAMDKLNVDHIVPHESEEFWFLNYNNLQTLCIACHIKKTEREKAHLEVNPNLTLRALWVANLDYSYLTEFYKGQTRTIIRQLLEKQKGALNPQSDFKTFEFALKNMPFGFIYELIKEIEWHFKKRFNKFVLGLKNTNKEKEFLKWILTKKKKDSSASQWD